MPDTSRPLRKLGFLTIGLFDEADPRPGHESTLEIIELGEQLGFDSAWVRHRHLQYGISSPVAVLAAASQRTSRIELGTAVIPLGWENPLRLAEDLATVDLLSGGRLNPGVSVGPPMHYDRGQAGALPGHRRRRGLQLRAGASGCCDFVRGEPATDFSGVEGFEVFSDRVQPHSAGLGRPHLVRRRQPALGPVGRRARDELPDQQRGQGRGVRGLRRDPAVPHPRRSAPTTPTATGPGVAGAGRHPHRQRLAGAAREVRGVRRAATAADRHAAGPGPADVRAGPRRHVGRRSPSGCYAHAAFREIDEVAFALPFTFEHDDYVQILTDIADEARPGARLATRSGT